MAWLRIIIIYLHGYSRAHNLSCLYPFCSYLLIPEEKKNWNCISGANKLKILATVLGSIVICDHRSFIHRWRIVGGKPEGSLIHCVTLCGYDRKSQKHPKKLVHWFAPKKEEEKERERERQRKSEWVRERGREREGGRRRLTHHGKYGEKERKIEREKDDKGKQAKRIILRDREMQ